MVIWGIHISTKAHSGINWRCTRLHSYSCILNAQLRSKMPQFSDYLVDGSIDYGRALKWLESSPYCDPEDFLCSDIPENYVAWFHANRIARRYWNRLTLEFLAWGLRCSWSDRPQMIRDDMLKFGVQLRFPRGRLTQTTGRSPTLRLPFYRAGDYYINGDTNLIQFYFYTYKTNRSPIYAISCFFGENDIPARYWPCLQVALRVHGLRCVENHSKIRKAVNNLLDSTLH